MAKRELKRRNSRIGYSRFLTTSSPFQLAAVLFAANLDRQHRKRRAAGRHGARAGREVKTVAVIGAADLCLLDDAGREVGVEDGRQLRSGRAPRRTIPRRAR